jgi:hypothetical protein
MPAAARSGGDLRLRDEEAEMTQLLLRAAEAVDEEPGTGTETAKAEAMARLATGDGGGGGGVEKCEARHGTARCVCCGVGGRCREGDWCVWIEQEGWGRAYTVRVWRSLRARDLVGSEMISV